MLCLLFLHFFGSSSDYIWSTYEYLLFLRCILFGFYSNYSVLQLLISVCWLRIFGVKGKKNLNTRKWNIGVILFLLHHLRHWGNGKWYVCWEIHRYLVLFLFSFVFCYLQSRQQAIKFIFSYSEVYQYSVRLRIVLIFSDRYIYSYVRFS